MELLLSLLRLVEEAASSLFCEAGEFMAFLVEAKGHNRNLEKKVEVSQKFLELLLDVMCYGIENSMIS